MTVQLVNEKTGEIESIDSKKDLIKRLYCKGYTDDEMELFMYFCKKTNLNPMIRQIYAIKMGSNIVMQASIDGLRLIAERTGNYTPGRESTYTYDEKGVLVSATSYIKKKTKDGVWHEVSAVAYRDEYDTKKGVWPTKPRVMLAKCAESQALRKAFPAELSGLYSEEEMSQAEPPKVSEPGGHGERREISEDDWAKFDALLYSVQDPEYEKKLKEHLKIESLYDMKLTDFDRTFRSLARKVKEQDGEEANVISA